MLAVDTSKPYTGAMTNIMHVLQVNLRVNKKFSPDRLKTKKRQPRQKLGYIYKKKKRKKRKQSGTCLSKVLSQNSNHKSLRSRFEMTHGCVSSSQTLIYPLLPTLSQSIIVFLNKKNQRRNHC